MYSIEKETTARLKAELLREIEESQDYSEGLYRCGCLSAVKDAIDKVMK